MEVTLHRNWGELELLSCEWNELLRASAADTLFLTWEWISTWWRHYGNGRPLYALGAREQKQLVGIAPFYLDSVPRLGVQWNCLKLIGDGSNDSDYQDLIVHAGYERDAVHAWVDFLAGRSDEWDTLEFESVPENSSCLAALLERVQKKNWRLTSDPVPCLNLRLARTWDEYLKSLKPRVRSKVRSSLAFLEKEMRSVPEQCGSFEQIDAWLPVLFDLHTQRWQSAGKPGVFRGQAKREFYRDFSRAALQNQWLAFHRLVWGERPLALQYGFLYRNRFLLLQEGYDPDFEDLRPGQTLRAWLVRHWISSGLDEYDFLAGSTQSKLEWGPRQTMSRRLRLTPKRSGAFVLMGLPHARDTVKDRVRTILPEALLTWRKELANGRNRSGFTPESSAPSGGIVPALARKVAASLYGATPLGSLGRRIASQYSLDSASSRRAFRRRTAPICQILIYHRVNDDKDPFLSATPVSVFVAQMEHVKRHFPIVSLDQIARGEWSPKGEEFCVAVTFDDGYRDNYTDAFPVLRRLGIPATIFLTTGCIETASLPWYDHVALAFKLTMARSLELGWAGGPEVAMASRAGRLSATARTLEWLWALPTDERLHRLAAVFRALRVPESPNLPNFMLCWDEIQEMGKHQITFGAHTVNHPVLARSSVECVRAEIQGSKETIENRLQVPVRHFAYPFGRCGDFTSNAKAILRDAGFETAVTTIPGYNRAGDDLLELKRFSPWGQNPGQFALQMDWHRLAGFTPQEEGARGLFGHEEPVVLPDEILAAKESEINVG